MMGFLFRYNEYERPSSKSYMAPIIKELEITKYAETQVANSSKVVFKVWIKGKTKELSEVAKEQLILFLMNRHDVKNYSDITLLLFEEDEKDNKPKDS